MLEAGFAEGYIDQISSLYFYAYAIGQLINGAASMLWSRYCPSLRDTGMVSSATGFLDFLSYMAAATANLIFANAVTAIGWGNLILVWLDGDRCCNRSASPHKSNCINEKRVLLFGNTRFDCSFKL